MTELGAELPTCTDLDTAGVTSGAGPPTSTPGAIGDIYVDTTNGDVYIATGTGSPADWTPAGGGTVTSGPGPPATIPGALGDHYIDTLNDNAYVAIDTTIPADWRQATGAGGGDLLAANNLSDVVSAATSAQNLDLEVGVDVQAWDTELDALATTTSAADALPYFTGAGTATTTTLTAAARTVLDDATTAAMLATLGGASTATRLDEFAVPTSDLDMNDQGLLQVGPVEERIQTVGATGAAETLDASEYGWFDMTMDQACTFTFSNPAASGEGSSFYLELSGAFTPTFPASVDWGDATPPTYTTPTTFVFTTSDAGATWLGTSPGKAFG